MRADRVGILAVVLAVGSAASAPAQANSYFCSAYDGVGGTVWITAIHPAGPGINALADAWTRYVKEHFVPNPGNNGAMCDVGTRESMALVWTTREKMMHSRKKVEVNWSFWKTAESEPAASAPNQGATTGQYVMCYSSPERSPLFVSSDFHIDVPRAPDPHSPTADVGASTRALDDLKVQFLAFLKTERKYKYTGAFPDYCSGALTTAELDGMRDRLHQRFPQVAVVETGWKPAAH